MTPAADTATTGPVLHTGSHPSSVVLRDLDGDGKPELVLASASTVGVQPGNGDGTFRSRVDYPTGAQPASVSVVDVNADGKPDLVAINLLDSASVLLGNGDGTFQGRIDYPTTSQPSGGVVADITGEGKPDIVMVGLGGTAPRLGVLPGNGDGTFGTERDVALTQRPAGAAVADLNGDGKRGKGDGAFQDPRMFPAGKPTLGLAVGDISGDGKLDVVTANNGDSTATVLLGNGDGTFQTELATPVDAEAFAVADRPVRAARRPDPDRHRRRWRARPGRPDPGDRRGERAARRRARQLRTRGQHRDARGAGLVRRRGHSTATACVIW